MLSNLAAADYQREFYVYVAANMRIGAVYNRNNTCFTLYRREQ